MLFLEIKDKGLSFMPQYGTEKIKELQGESKNPKEGQTQRREDRKNGGPRAACRGPGRTWQKV